MKEWKNTFRVGPYMVEMTFLEGRGCLAEWSPKPNGPVGREYLDQYRAGRDALLAEVSKELGGSIVVVET